MRKVAILGKCSNTREDVPMGHVEWEIWCLAWDPTPIAHRLFEIHKNWRAFHGEGSDDAGFHRRWLMGQKIPVYMLDKEHDIPTSVRYPTEAAADLVGRTAQGTPYLESSIAYMMALAILELSAGDKIGIWGVDLHVATEYAYQRPNMEYLIGLARGRGIKVFIPPESALLTHAAGKPYGHWSASESGVPQTPP